MNIPPSHELPDAKQLLFLIDPCYCSALNCNRNKAPHLSSCKILEVVSKPQVRFKGPPKADYISNLKKIKVCIKRQADPPSPSGLWRDKSGKRSPPEADEHLPEAVLHPNL